jgi:hypothetical protein
MKETVVQEPARISAPVAQPAAQQPVPTRGNAQGITRQWLHLLSLENDYIASVRATLNANKRYPNRA